MPGPNITVDASKLEPVLCTACGGSEFVPRAILRYLPGILSPNGMPAIVTLADGVRCVACDTIISMAEMQTMAKDFHADDSGLVTPGGAPIPPEIQRGMSAKSPQGASVIKLTDVRAPHKEEETKG